MSADRLSLQRVDLALQDPFSRYLTETAAICPFIEPAAREGLLFTCEVTADCQSAGDIHPRSFEQLVPCIEQFRDHRRSLSPKQRLLICYCTVIHLPSSLDAAATQLLTWPNWLGVVLKEIYTPREIVLGFVRKNFSERSSLGTPVPVAPFHAVVIRSRVVGTDGRFFTGNQPLLTAMMQAQDDDTDAHAGLVEDVPNIREAQAMREAAYFERLRRRSLKRLSQNRLDERNR